MLGNLQDDMALFKLVVAGVILYAFKNYVHEMRLYLQKHRSVVWLSSMRVMAQLPPNKCSLVISI